MQPFTDLKSRDNRTGDMSEHHSAKDFTTGGDGRVYEYPERGLRGIHSPPTQYASLTNPTSPVTAGGHEIQHLQPMSAYPLPIQRYGMADPGYQQPTELPQEAMTDEQAPIPVYQQPTPGYQIPITATAQPQTTSALPDLGSRSYINANDTPATSAPNAQQSSNTSRFMGRYTENEKRLVIAIVLGTNYTSVKLARDFLNHYPARAARYDTSKTSGPGSLATAANAIMDRYRREWRNSAFVDKMKAMAQLDQDELGDVRTALTTVPTECLTAVGRHYMGYPPISNPPLPSGQKEG